MANSANNTLPTLTSTSDLIRVLKKWQTQLNPLLKISKTPHAPWNFQATGARGGIILSWAPLSTLDADGYIVQRSDNGDFSNPTNIPIQNARQSSYFDPIGGTTGGTAPIKKWYKLRATNGTPQNPQSVLGLFSGIVTTTSIDPTDTTTVATTVLDVTTTDKTQQAANRGRIVGGARKAEVF